MNSAGSVRQRSRSLATFLVTVGLAAGSLVAVLESGAIAATAGWSSPAAVDSGNTLLGVSCAGASFCAAVDNAGNALTFNGSTWTAPTKVDTSSGLFAVSCTSSTFCIAVDDSGNAFDYDGSKGWIGPTSIDPKYQNLTAVSCVPSNFCVAVDAPTAGNGNAFIFNGATWSGPIQVASSDIGLDSVACASSTFCVAGDGVGAVSTWTGGTAWSPPMQIADGSDPVISLSCPSPSFCAAATATGKIAVFNGTAWSGTANIDPTNGLSGVSCSDSSFCVASANGPDVFTYNGTSWSTPSSIDPGQYLSAVSCTEDIVAYPPGPSTPPASFCAAVDTTGNALATTGSGTAPTVTEQPTSQTVTAGQTATFTASATGNPAPQVSWEASTDGGNTYTTVQGASSQTLTIAGTTVAESGNLYRAIFENSAGSTVTQAATLSVNPAPLTVSANPQSIQYGQAIPTLTYTITGFVNGDNASVVSGSPQLSTPATSGTTSRSDVGTYPIDISIGTLSAANYTFIPEGSTLTVTQAPTTLTTTSALIPAPALNADLTYDLLGTKTGIAGQLITFATNGTTLCTIGTDASGKATCDANDITSPLNSAALAVAAATGNYTVSYGGAKDFEPASTRG